MRLFFKLVNYVFLTFVFKKFKYRIGMWRGDMSSRNKAVLADGDAYCHFGLGPTPNVSSLGSKLRMHCQSESLSRWLVIADRPLNIGAVTVLPYFFINTSR